MKLFFKLILTGTLLSLYSCKYTTEFSYKEFDYSDFRYYNLPMGDLPVGFHSELLWDESRTFNGMDKRPLLIGLWYPAELSDRSVQLDYKDYLIANSEHDGVAINDTTAKGVENAFINGVEAAFSVNKEDAVRLMDLPVRAFDNTEVIGGKHPLLLYAASFNAGIHENSAICEYLASKGYIVASIASVGHDTPVMTGDSLGIAAQRADFELLYETMIGRSYIDTDKVAASGFSWGGFPTTLLGLDKELKLMISLDGSQTYFPQAVAMFQNTYDQPAKGAYIQLSQRERPNAQIKLDTMVYHWMGQSADAYLYRFKAMDHRDFGGSFQHVHTLSHDSTFLGGQERLGLHVYSKNEKGEGYLKIAEMMEQALNAYLRGSETDKAALNNQPESLFSINKRSSR